MDEMSIDVQRKLGIEAGLYFHPSSPIGSKELFSGRIKQIQQVFEAIFQKGLHVIIFGERGVGKTSLANVLKDLLPPQDGLLSSVRVQCNYEDTFEKIWYRVFNTMQLTKSSKSVGFSNEDTTIKLEAGHFFNQLDLFSPDAVRDALLKVENIYQIIIIDEFDRTNNDVKKMFADLIKNMSDYSIPSTIILIGVGQSIDDLISEHASVTRALKQIHMPRMSSKEIESIISIGLDKMGMEIENNSKKQITLMAQGLPYYAHLLGLHSTRNAIEQSSFTINSEHIKNAINTAIDDSQQSIKSDYQKAILSARKENIFSDVLLSAAMAANKGDEGDFSAQDICHILSKIKSKNYEISTFAKHLNEFSDKKRCNILSKSGELRRYRYKFTDPLMQPYVIMRGLIDDKIDDLDLDY